MSQQEREIAFDETIYALGSHVDVDNVPGVAEHAYRLDPGDGSRSAAALRSRLHQNADRPVRVIAVGGGPLATEVAGEIKTASPDAEVAMISQRCCDFAGPRVGKAVCAELGRLDVQLIDGDSVSEVRPTEIITETGRSIPCEVRVWSAGMRGSSIAHRAGLATGKQARILVDPKSMTLKGRCPLKLDHARIVTDDVPPLTR